MIEIDDFNYEECLEKHFEIGFFDKLFEYIVNLDVKFYVHLILKYITRTVKNLEPQIEINNPRITRSIEIQAIKDISKIKKLSFGDFIKLTHTTPALIPIMLLFMRTHIYLNKISNRNSFMNSITISFDKETLLKEIWGNNLCSGSCTNKQIKEAFPIIQQQWIKYPKIQKQYDILGFLHACVNKAIYKPIEKLEDRLIMDIDTLLDNYFHTEDEAGEFIGNCGMPFIPDASDKLKSIFKGNIKNPDRFKKEKELLETYLESYHDYKKYKFWHKKLKFIIKNINNCHQKIRNKNLDSNLSNEQLEDFENAIDLIFSCNENKKDCNKYDNKKCTKNWHKNLYDYIKTQDEDLYYVLIDKFHNKTFDELEKYINSTREKEFAFCIIKEFYPLLKNKTNKTIQNRFANRQRDEKLNWQLTFYNNQTRNFNFDHKEAYEKYTLKEELLDNFSELYGYYEEYTYEPSEIYYKRIMKLIIEIDKILKNNPDLN